MKNQIQFIVDEVLREPSRKLVILMTSTHPMTDSNLARTGHEIYNLNLQQFPIKWEGPVPENMHIINDIGELPHRPDIIISQNVVDQYNVFKQLSYTFDSPLIEFEHTVPSQEWIELGVLDQMKSQILPNSYVFITDYSRKEWQRDEENTHVLYHMVDTELFSGWTGGNGKAAIMCNSFKNREWAVGNVEELLLKDGGKRVSLFGHNPGFNSVPISRNAIPETLGEYDVFINTSLRSPIPASLLEAASIGMPLVSPKTCAIPDFFEEGKSIRYYENYDECLEIVDVLLANKEERKRLGAAARQVILDSFNEEKYINQWNNIFTYTLEKYHNG
jgi:glycosyltransferase involved in cell wall biosynthesis